MAQEVLYPFGGKPLGFQETGNGVPEDVRIEMFSSGMRVFNARGFANLLDDVVDQADGNGFSLVGKKNRSLLAGAYEVFYIAHRLILDDRDDADLVALASNLDALAIKIDVSHVEIAEFFAAQSQPEQGLYNAAVPEVVGRDDELFHFG